MLFTVSVMYDSLVILSMLPIKGMLEMQDLCRLNLVRDETVPETVK